MATHSLDQSARSRSSSQAGTQALVAHRALRHLALLARSLVAAVLLLDPVYVAMPQTALTRLARAQSPVSWMTYSPYLTTACSSLLRGVVSPAASGRAMLLTMVEPTDDDRHCCLGWASMCLSGTSSGCKLLPKKLSKAAARPCGTEMMMPRWAVVRFCSTWLAREQLQELRGPLLGGVEEARVKKR